MELVEQKHGAVTVIRPEGALVGDDVLRFASRVGELASASLGRIVIDAQKIPFVDSAGLEALLDLSDALARGGRSLKLCNEGETIREVLSLTELDGYFEHYEDVSSAVRSFS